MSGTDDTFYCGVNAEDIIASLYEAIAAIRELMPYPATLAMLDRWEEDKPLAFLSSASDTNSFIRALEQTGVKSWLNMLEPVFEYGALKGSDPSSSRADQKYLTIYKDLARWGAFDYWYVKEDPRYYSSLQAREQAAFLATAKARDLPDYLSPLDLSLSRQFNQSAAAKGENLAARWGLFMQFRVMAKDNPRLAMSVFDNFTPEDQRFVSGVCHKLSGHGLQKQMLRHMSPFQIYGMTVKPGSEALNSKLHRQKCRPVLNAVKKILHSEFKNHWVRASAVGAITYDRQNIGPLLATAYPVAEKVAARFPDHKILTRSGRQIGVSGTSSPKIW